nr:hypothetical protein [Arthrobacter alpinus]
MGDLLSAGNFSSCARIQCHSRGGSRRAGPRGWNQRVTVSTPIRIGGFVGPIVSACTRADSSANLIAIPDGACTRADSTANLIVFQGGARTCADSSANLIAISDGACTRADSTVNFIVFQGVVCNRRHGYWPFIGGCDGVRPLSDHCRASWHPTDNC